MHCDIMHVDKEVQYGGRLGHVGHMSDDRLPNRFIISSSSRSKACWPTRLMWSDLARNDLTSVRRNIDG